MSVIHKQDKPTETEALKKELAEVKAVNEALERQTTDLQVAIVELYEMAVMQNG